MLVKIAYSAEKFGSDTLILLDFCSVFEKIAYSAEKFGSDTLILLDFCSVFEKIFGPSGLFGCCMSNLGFQMLIPDVGYQMSDVGWHL